MTEIVTVDIAPFRARFLHLKATEQLTATGLAMRLGWTRTASGEPGRIVADQTRARRAVGLAPETTGRREIRTRVQYRTALLLAEAMHMDPHEWDF